MPDRRITLVTGASRGIGRAVALALAARGDHVVALARSRQALETLDDEIRDIGGDITLVPLDLTDGKAIDTLGDALSARFGRLDGLIGNAGVLGTIGPVQTMTPKAFEDLMTVNVTANWRLIRALEGLMRASDAPRAVFVTSGVVPRPRAFWGPYQASKAALEHLALAWAKENEKFPLRVNLFDPGATRTAMRADAMPGEDPETLPAPEAVAEELIKLVASEESRTASRIAYRDLVDS